MFYKEHAEVPDLRGRCVGTCPGWRDAHLVRRKLGKQGPITRTSDPSHPNLLVAGGTLVILGQRWQSHLAERALSLWFIFCRHTFEI